MTNDHDITREEWDRVNAQTYGDMLAELWSPPMVGLSAAIYWVALRGSLSEPDDVALEQSASDLMAAAKDGTITVYGYRRDIDKSPFLSSIPLEAFFEFRSLIPESADIAAMNNGEPQLWLNFVLAGCDRDRITRFVDEIIVDSLCIRREDMLRRWPAGPTRLREMCQQIIDMDGQIGQKAAWGIIRRAGFSISRDDFESVWKSLVGPQKRGPKGPRVFVRGEPDNFGQSDN